MKLSAIIILLFFATTLKAQTHITSIEKKDEHNLYIGLIKEETPMDKLAKLIVLSTKDLKKTHITLPVELQEREIMALSSLKNHLLVVTQRTIGGGDNPLIHLYNLKNKTWHQQAEVVCPTFDKIKITKDQVGLSCYFIDDKTGKDIQKLQNIKIKEKNILIKRDIEIPQTVKNTDKIKLLKDEFELKTIQINDKKLSAEDLYKP